MPTALKAVPATRLIKEEYPLSYRAGGDAQTLSYAQEAREVLGYDLDKTKQKVPRILAAFQEHDLPLFRPSDVDAYKEQQARRVERKANRRVKLWDMSCTVLGCVAVAMTVIFFALWIIGVSDVAQVKAPMIGAGLATVVTFCGMCFCMWRESESAYIFGNAKTKWENYSVKKFPDQIPQEVIKQMIEIKQLIPNSVFVVSKLTMTRRKVRRPIRSSGWLDPILSVTIEGDKYLLPIAVWDEPKFDGTPIMASSDIS